MITNPSVYGENSKDDYNDAYKKVNDTEHAVYVLSHIYDFLLNGSMTASCLEY